MTSFMSVACRDKIYQIHFQFFHKLGSKVVGLLQMHLFWPCRFTTFSSVRTQKKVQWVVTIQQIFWSSQTHFSWSWESADKTRTVIHFSKDFDATATSWETLKNADSGNSTWKEIVTKLFQQNRCFVEAPPLLSQISEKIEKSTWYTLSRTRYWHKWSHKMSHKC